MRGQRHASGALHPGKHPVPIAQEAGWSPGPVWTGAENLAPSGIRSPDRPANRYTDYGTRPIEIRVVVCEYLYIFTSITLCRGKTALKW